MDQEARVTSLQTKENPSNDCWGLIVPPHSKKRAIFGGCACAPRGEDSPKGSRSPEAQSRPCAGFGPTMGFGRSDVSLAFWLLFLEKVTPVTRQCKLKGKFKLSATSNRPPHQSLRDSFPSRGSQRVAPFFSITSQQPKGKPTSYALFLHNNPKPHLPFQSNVRWGLFFTAFPYPKSYAAARSSSARLLRP